MHPEENDFPPINRYDATEATPPATPSPSSENESREPRNLALLAIHQIAFRTGWIFKTESVIMPAFLDWLVGPGGGLLRGCLPVLNRFGQSVPPIFCADWLKSRRHKKTALAVCIMAMSLPFAALATMCHAITCWDFPKLPWLFLLIYGIFAVGVGLYHLSFGTIQGKLIRPTRRGRLMLISTFWGSLPAMFFAWWLLREWLELPDGGYHYIFAFTAVTFFLSGLIVLLLDEPADRPDARHPRDSRGCRAIAQTYRTLRNDRNLRRLVGVAILFGSGLMVFPHYQAFARDSLGLTGGQLMVWVIAQNISVGICSLFVGPLADILGNRIALRITVFGSALAPLLAVFFGQHSTEYATNYFWTVYVALGVTPLVLRVLVNYTLEIASPGQHPRYLSTLSLCMATPFIASPLVGRLVDIDTVGYQTVFLVAAGLIVGGGFLTFALDEPRHDLADAPTTDITEIGVGDET